MKRHLTATGFVVDGSRTLLHWHRRLQQWMPPGGHIEADEDPVQAVVREIREETGLEADVISLNAFASFANPRQMPAPYTILIEDIPARDDEAAHQHIDLIYFCRPVDGAAAEPVADPTLRWVDESELRLSKPLDVAGCGVSVPVPEDVRELALIAIGCSQQVLDSRV